MEMSERRKKGQEGATRRETGEESSSHGAWVKQDYIDHWQSSGRGWAVQPGDMLDGSVQSEVLSWTRAQAGIISHNS